MRLKIVYVCSLAFCFLFLQQRDEVSAQQPPQKIVTKSEAELKTNSVVVGKTRAAEILDILQTNGQWYWVDSNGTKGWVNKNDVVPYADAITYFSNEIKNKPEAGYYFARATLYRSQGKLPETINDLNSAINLETENSILYYNRGSVYNQKGEFTKGIEDFNKAIQLDPKYAYAYNDRGISYRGLGKLTEALESYTLAIALKPDFPTAYYNRAVIKSDQGNRAEAILDLNEAIQYDPSFIQAYQDRGFLYHLQGNFEEAIKNFNLVLERSPNNSLAYNNLGFCSMKLHKYNDALGHYKKCIELEPENGLFLTNYANLLSTCSDEKIRNSKEAVKYGEKAYKLLGDKNWVACRNYASALAADGNFKEAITLQTKAIENAPEKEKEGQQARLELYKNKKPFIEAKTK